MKKSLSIVLALLLAFALIGCSGGASSTAPASTPASTAVAEDSSEAPSPAANGETYKVGFILGDMVNEFYLQMVEAGDQAAADYGVEVIWQSCDSSVEKEVSLIENFILQGVDCIVLDPMDAEGVVAACDAATEAGIPVVTCANMVNGKENYMTLYTDRENIELATTAICYAIGEEGKLGLLSGDAGSWVIGQREQGFTDAIAKFPNITGDIQLTKYDTAVAANITENWINTGGIDGIVSVSDGFVLASVTAAENLGAADDIYWAGNDGNIENHSIMNNGHQLIDHLTGGFRVGYWNVAVAARLCAGEDLPREMYLNCHTVMTDDAAAMLKERGFECEYVTPEEAEKIATNAGDEYGPSLSTTDFIG